MKKISNSYCSSEGRIRSDKKKVPLAAKKRLEGLALIFGKLTTPICDFERYILISAQVFEKANCGLQLVLVLRWK
jgi:hypothetical protein